MQTGRMTKPGRRLDNFSTLVANLLKITDVPWNASRGYLRQTIQVTIQSSMALLALQQQAPQPLLQV